MVVSNDDLRNNNQHDDALEKNDMAGNKNNQDDETKEPTLTVSNVTVNVPSVVNISITHCNEQKFATRLSASLNTKGYTTIDNDSLIGEQMVVAIITDGYFANAHCVKYLRSSKNTATIIQPVVRFEDASSQKVSARYHT